MKYLAMSLIWVGFFALIGIACYWSGTGWPLWALLLAPEIEFKETKENEVDN